MSLIKSLWQTWKRLGQMLGQVQARLIFSAIFALFFVPVGLWRRLRGRDTLRLRFEPGRASYRDLTPPLAPESMQEAF